MPRILHTGDIHLDSPFAGLDPRRREIRKNELRAAFTSMLTYARTCNVDLILIAGDCFDSRFATRDTVALIKDGFESVPNIKIVISPGNHDPYTPESVWARTAMPKNVTVFKSSELSSADFDGLGVTVYGYAFTSPEMTASPIEGKHIADPSRLNLLCAHAELDAPLTAYCPITERLIAAFGADYSALGHIHKAGTLHQTLGKTYGYCGCLEGRDFGECGYKGAVVFDAEKRGADCDIHAKRVRFCKRRYECIEVAVDGAQNTVDVRNAVKTAVTGKFGDETLLRITLTGEVPPSLTITPVALDADNLGVFYAEFKDETSPLLDVKWLESDVSVRGELYRALLPVMRDGNEQERKTAAAAFRYAMSALGGHDF